MNAEQYLYEALGGNLHIGMLKPFAFYQIMEGYAKQKILEASEVECNRCGDLTEPINISK